MNADLALALELADDADRQTLAPFRDRGFRVSRKADGSPVTEVDRATELALRRRIVQARPDHLVVGEEMPDEGPEGAATRWILDPVDGTRNYIRGVPVFATLIGVERDRRMIAGVVSAPALGMRWWAARGEGARMNGRAIRVSDVGRVDDAMLGYDELPELEQHGLGTQFLALARRVARTRGFGDFLSHVLVAEGAMDIAVEPEVSVWDVAAVQVIVEEAGGRFTDLGGAPRADGGSAVSTNGRLHDEVLAALRR